jgi:hypothetical protein
MATPLIARDEAQGLVGLAVVVEARGLRQLAGPRDQGPQPLVALTDLVLGEQDDVEVDEEPVGVGLVDEVDLRRVAEDGLGDEGPARLDQLVALPGGRSRGGIAVLGGGLGPALGGDDVGVDEGEVGQRLEDPGDQRRLPRTVGPGDEQQDRVGRTGAQRTLTRGFLLFVAACTTGWPCSSASTHPRPVAVRSAVRSSPSLSAVGPRPRRHGRWPARAR